MWQKKRIDELSFELRKAHHRIDELQTRVEILADKLVTAIRECEELHKHQKGSE